MVKHIHLPIPNQRSESATSHVVVEGAVRTTLTRVRRKGPSSPLQRRRSLSVTITRGGVMADFRSFLRSRCAARVSLRRWTRTSRTKPFWSTARHGQCCSPAIETTTSSRRHCRHEQARAGGSDRRMLCRTSFPTGARSRRSRKSRASPTFLRPCEGSGGTGNGAKQRG